MTLILTRAFHIFIVEEFGRFFLETWPNWEKQLICTGFDYDQKKLLEIEGILYMIRKKYNPNFPDTTYIFFRINFLKNLRFSSTCKREGERNRKTARGSKK